MHRGHDHDLDLESGSLGGGRHGGTVHRAPLPGHNRVGASDPAQWQTPHLHTPHDHHAGARHEADLDQIETAFVDSFATATDPTSFLRLANIPFETTVADGTKLVLLRVETDSIVDVGSVMPHFGGVSFRYDPLPAKLAAKRRRLRFVYFDGTELRMLGFAEARDLGAPKTDAKNYAMTASG
jgi:hypothetical protein